MHSSMFFLAAPLLASLSLASPTPVNPRGACTTITPSILQIVSEGSPSTTFPNTVPLGGHFVAYTDAGKKNRTSQAVAFTDIPKGAWGCSLNIILRSDSDLVTIGKPVLDIATIAKENSKAIAKDNRWTWKDFHAKPSPIDIGLFGTLSGLEEVAETDSDLKRTINVESCPTDLSGGGNLAFLFSIASWINGEAGVYWNSLLAEEFTGVYLTYNC